MHYIDLPGPGNPLVVLHSLLGSSQEWQPLAQRWANDLQRRVVVVDLRNHGQSFHDSHHSIPAMAKDVAALLHDLNLIDNVTLLGHSMGGKVAMRLALDYTDCVASMISLDMAPSPDDLTYVAALLANLQALNIESLAEVAQVDAALAVGGLAAETRQYILQNVNRCADGKLSWCVNLPSLSAGVPALAEAVVASAPFPKPTLFVRAGISGYITEDDEHHGIPVLFPRAIITTIPNVGHFLHLESPEAVFQLVSQYLSALA
ncbi:alpha/beta fold hydrolase [Microvirga sp. STR05]|uniref:Alpha/beta fold hydrolase n=1 Tax=Hymenobacter duratus TaxID=2771356 RepID=A0ABR8JBI9_9BACT|nr:alpha/beta fold hydrolase [Hymenobacter duratus]MBD2714079.1 alpha/beta fold hydrolase [Hymenobacter duratus]MBR7948981.1 alpha/beta fold hydrolase [Microvirga sp. STR05]